MPDGANDRIADLFTRRALDLQRLAAQEQRQVRSFLRDLEDELVAATARVDPTGVSRPSARQNRLEKLLEQVRDTIRASFRDASSTLRGEMRELAEIEAGAVARMINQGAGFQLADASLTRNQARELIEGTLVQGSPVSDWMRQQAGDTLERFRREMRMGIAEGETNAQLVRRIRGGTQDGSPVAGFMETSRRNAESLARSATQAVAQAAKDRTYEQNADVLKGIMWMATLDNRTTVGCGVRDGLLYEIGTHEPIGHSLPWDGGPGNRHWGAVAEGALIRTNSGLVPIEVIRVGDTVLTHDGSWSPVTATMRKRAQHGVIRVAHMKSGRVLRATYDHPVWKPGAGWVFMGRIKAGDQLCCDPYGMEEVVRASRLVVSEAEDSPSCGHQSQIALERTLKFVAAKIGLKSGEQVGAREIEDRAIGMVLRDPLGVYSDQSAMHHNFALAHVLGQVGMYRLRNVLALLRSFGAAVDFADALIKPVSLIGLNYARKYFGVMDRVVFGHSFGMTGIVGVSFLGFPESPVIRARGVNYSTSGVVENGLLSFAPHGDRMALGVTGKRPIGQTFLALNPAQGDAIPDVAALNEVSQSRVELGHDEVLSIGVQTETRYVYDLEVQGNSSYFANGVAVSNCRSTSAPVTKSFRDLGIDADEVPAGTRASMDGQAPQETDFGSWLERQSKARQDDVLGPGRADLWRDGKIGFRDLVDGQGRELTLEQLRARI